MTLLTTGQYSLKLTSKYPEHTFTKYADYMYTINEIPTITYSTRKTSRIQTKGIIRAYHNATVLA